MTDVTILLKPLGVYNTGLPVNELLIRPTRIPMFYGIGNESEF